MAVSKPANGGDKQAPKTEPKKAPDNAPKKPQDNKAAKQAPKETRTAVNNAFGDAPKNDAKAAPATGPKSTAPAPADGKAAPSPADGKAAPAAPDGNTTVTTIGKTPFGNPANPKMSNIVADGKTPPADGKTAPAPADGKAAPAPADGKAAPALADGKAAPAPADGKTVPAPADDPKTTPDTDPKAAPANQQGPLTVTNLPANPKMAIVDDPKAAPGTDAKTPLPPVDPKVQEILDTKLPDGKTVKEKIDADSPNYIVKAAQDHYNKQKESGEPLDNASKFYLNNSAKYIADNGVKQDDVTPDKLNDVFDKEQIDKNLEEIAKDPDFNKWATEQQANSVQKTIEDNPDIAKLVTPYQQPGENAVNALRRMQSEYMSSKEFADGVAKAKTAEEGKALVTDGIKTLSSLGLGEKETLGVANTLTENIRSKYTPDAPKAVIDPNTNKAVQTEDGNNLATLPDGTSIALATDGKAVADKQANAYVYNPDGTAQVDANDKYVQYDAKAKTSYVNYNGTKYLVGNANAGNSALPGNNLVSNDVVGKIDAQGRPLAIDDSGAPVALDKEGKAATDLAGNKLVFNPDTGKAVTDPESGNQVVIDPVTKAVVQTDVGGTIVAAKNGDPYAVDQTTGKFVQDAQGRYVQISKDNVAPGIVPGYVVDTNNTRMVVGPYDGKPMVDPATDKTVILDPKTNAPQLVPLDANGAPKLANDGKNIVYDETGNTVVPNEGKGPDWLVDDNGNYAQNANGNYIGVDKQTGLAAPVDQNGFVKNANGLTPLWDTKANATMTTPDGDQVMIDGKGNLLMANAQGQTWVEEKSGLPLVLDPKTREVAVNPDTGRSLLLDQGGALVEYNADDGYKYLIDPKTRTTVKTSEGNPVVMSDSAGAPYAVTPDGTVVKNPATGNTVVYGLDGQPAKEVSTGNYLEITANGKAHVIDPKTNAPMAQKDPATGGYQVYNADGSALTNPDSGNKIQMAPGSTLKVEIDAKTSKPVEDGNGNILLMGPDNRPLKTPEGNAIVADNKSGVPMAVDAQGKAITDPASGLPQAVNTDTGMPVTDPQTGAAVVIDPQSGKPVQIDPKTKEPIKDPDTGLNIIANGKTGAQLQGPNGEPVVVAPGLGMPGYFDKTTNTFTGFDLATGKAITNSKTGATVILDPDLGVPAEVMPDQAGNLVLVDGNGEVQTDGKGNALLLDKDTGQIVVKDENGKVVDAGTGKTPEKVAMKAVAHLLPLAQVPSIVYNWKTGKEKTAAGEQPGPLADPADSTAVSDAFDTSSVPDGPFSYTTTPEEREAIKAGWDAIDDWGDFKPKSRPNLPYAYYEKKVLAAQAANSLLANIPVEDLAVLMRYTASSRGINRALRSGDPARIALYEASAKGIRSAVNQLRELGYSYSGELFRNINQTDTEINSDWKVKTQIKDPGFISTSIDPNVANEFGNLRLKFNTDIGVDISAASVLPKQKEVLILDGSEWNITSDGFYQNSKIGPRRFHPNAFRELDPVSLLDEPPATSASAAAEALSNPGSPSRSTGSLLDIELNAFPSRQPSDFSIGAQSTYPMVSTSQAAANTSKWTKLGTTLGYVFDGLDIVGGVAQVVLGGIQIDDGIKNKNPYDIASGSLNVVSGALGISAGVAGVVGLIGGAVAAAAAAAVPLAAASFIVGGIAGIVDFVGSLDDDEQFADKLDKDFGSLGILKDGWRPKAEEAHRDGYSEYYQPNYQA